MTKIKYLLAFITLSLLIYSCGSSSTTPTENIDYVAKAAMDKDSLDSFLAKHYYDSDLGSIKPLVDGKLPLNEDSNLKDTIIDETLNGTEISFKLFYYMSDIGIPTVDKGFPTVMDSVFVKYSGYSIVNTDSISNNSFDNNTSGVWLTLDKVIRGWTHGFTKFKGGDNISNPNDPISYEKGGKGILIIPSGLAYPQGSANALSGQNILFYIDLWDFVENTDHDNDSIPSIFEDPDDDGDPRNDDTNQNNFPNYNDPDDDGDGTLTKDEDANKDGDPRNDDTDGDGIADYLDPDNS